MAAIGPQATLNATAGGDVALVQVAQADDAQGATQTLALNVGRIEARNVWLAARSSVAGVGGDIHVAAGSALSAVGVASLLAGNNLYVAAPSNGQPGGLISAGQRMNSAVTAMTAALYGKASAITIDGRLLAPEIVIHGSETGANTVRFGATADAGGALDGNGLLTQGNTMRILGGSGQDDIEIRARLIAQQLLTVSTQDGDDRVVLQSTETSGGVRIETGAGDDTVSVIDTRVGGGLSILTGDGGNVVTLDTATVGGDTSITSGKDADQITLVNSGLVGGLTIDAGDGGNAIKLDTTTVGGATRITSGKDADLITLVNSGLDRRPDDRCRRRRQRRQAGDGDGGRRHAHHERQGRGSDHAGQQRPTGGLTIDAGDGGNVVKLETVTAGGDTRITSGKDADQITLVNSG